MRLFNTTWFYYLNGNAIDDEAAVEITSDMEGFRIRDDFVLEIESRIIRNSMFLFCKREYIGHIMQSGTVILDLVSLGIRTRPDYPQRYKRIM